MLSKNFIVFGQPLIEEDEINEVVDSLRNAWLGTGPKVIQFENDFKEYKQTAHAAAVSSCTAGLFLALKALNIGPGDEVITSAMTFVATVNSIIHCGAQPVLADIDHHSLNIDPNEIERRITTKTKAIIPVHFAGRPCDMDAIMYLARKHNLFVIEDCAHAIEARYYGKEIGTFGDFGVFSFYATKNITTGEGGMVVSNDLEKINIIKKLALHGLSKDAWKRYSDSGYQHYYAEEAGYKFNMTDIQAAIGIHQLGKIEKFYLRRLEIWNYYIERLSKFNLQLPSALPDGESRHALHLFTLEFRNGDLSRDEFLDKMTNMGIGLGVHYLAIPRHPFYREKFKESKLPNAIKFGDNVVSIPISPKLTNAELERIVSAITSLMS